jgi:hypothetical protein
MQNLSISKLSSYDMKFEQLLNDCQGSKVGGLSVVRFSFEAPNAQVRALHITKFIHLSSHDMKFEQLLNDRQGRDWFCEENVRIMLAK